MGNCLKTQLKESVNANLPIFDTVRLTVNHEVADALAQDNREFVIKAQDANLVTIVNKGGEFLDAEGNNLGNTILLDASEHTYRYTAATNMILIKNKAGVRDLQCYTGGVNVNALIVSLEDAKYMTTITSFTCGGSQQTGKLSNVPISDSMWRLLINSSKVEGTLEDVRDRTSVTNMRLISDYITGDVESLIHKSDGSLRPAGTMQLFVGYQKVKYKGEYIGTSLHTVVFDGLGGITVDGV